MAPPNAVAQCVEGGCRITCNEGFHPCGTPGEQACKRDDDSSFCGPSCENCTRIDFADLTCRANACAYDCGLDRILCRDEAGPVACGPSKWDFEAIDQIWDWHGRDSQGTFLDGRQTPDRALSGSFAFGIDLAVTAGDRLTFAGLPCRFNGRHIDLRGKTVLLNVFLDGPLALRCALATSPDEERPLTEAGREVYVGQGLWTQLSHSFQTPGAGAVVGVYLDCVVTNTESARGTLYLDEVSIQ